VTTLIFFVSVNVHLFLSQAREWRREEEDARAKAEAAAGALQSQLIEVSDNHYIYMYVCMHTSVSLTI